MKKSTTRFFSKHFIVAIPLIALLLLSSFYWCCSDALEAQTVSFSQKSHTQSESKLSHSCCSSQGYTCCSSGACTMDSGGASEKAEPFILSYFFSTENLNQERVLGDPYKPSDILQNAKEKRYWQYINKSINSVKSHSITVQETQVLRI